MRNSKFKIQNSKFFRFLLVFGFISTFSSCTNDSITNLEKSSKENSLTSRPAPGPIELDTITYPNPPVQVLPKVYAVYNDTQPGVYPSNQTAKLRIDGNITTLSSEKSGAYSVSVSNNNDVYVGGYESINNIVSAKIWKNGLTSFTLQNYPSAVTSIVTNNNDIYFVAGNRVYKNNVLLYQLSTTGTVWSNSSCAANSIYVYGSDVYLCGQASCKAVLVWKNGVIINGFPQISTNIDYLRGASIYVDNTGVYVAGWLDGKAKIWKNATQINLPMIAGSSRSDAISITGDNTNVYVAGSNNDNTNNTGRLWKMNKATNFANVEKTYNGARNSVFIHQGDIYTGGWEKIWKNSNIIYSDTGGFNNSVYIK